MLSQQAHANVFSQLAYATVHEYLGALIHSITASRFFTYIHKRNNATETFSEIYEHILKIHKLFTSLRHLYALTYGPLRLSCVFLANYVPNELGSIFFCAHLTGK